MIVKPTKGISNDSCFYFLINLYVFTMTLIFWGEYRKETIMNYKEKAEAYAKDKMWGKAENMMAKYIRIKDEVKELHFAYNAIINYAYKQRKEDDYALDRCLEYCIEDIQLLPKFKRVWNNEFNDFATLSIPSIDRGIRILKDKEEYNRLESLLNKIIDLYRGTDKEKCYQKKLAKIKEKSKDNKSLVETKTRKNVPKNTDEILNLQNDELVNFFNSDNWFCTISFKKSRSKNFSQALQLAEMAPEYNEYTEEDNIIYQATYGAKPDEYLSMLNLWELVKGWKSSFMNINGEIVDKNTFSKMNRCYADKCRENTSDFCYGVSMYTKNPLGCHRAKIHESGDPWYKFGKVDDEGIFHLDRKWLREETIKRLITYRFCPALDIREVLNNIEKLPNIVNPKNSDEWEYTTYLNTTTDEEYKGIERPNELAYSMEININLNENMEKSKIPEKNIVKKEDENIFNSNIPWGWLLGGGVLVLTPLWLVGIISLLIGIYKIIKK